jgi:hypothetical protein
MVAHVEIPCCPLCSWPLPRFLVTKAHPPVFWKPAEDSPQTNALYKKQKQEQEEWKVGAWGAAGGGQASDVWFQ